MRQTELAGAAVREERVVATNSYFRLNPAERRHAFQTEMSGSALVGQTSVELDDEIVVEGMLKCGLGTRVTCDQTALRGVAAKLSLSKEETVIAELVLLHRDPSLNITVARSSDMEDLAADWQMWGRRYNLPLILVEADGVEQLVSERLGSVEVAQPTPRRPHAMFAARRPRFLTRRKTGSVDTSNRLAGREIIARD